MSNTVIVNNKTRSPMVAFWLSVFFGPLGGLYVSGKFFLLWVLLVSVTLGLAYFVQPFLAYSAIKSENNPVVTVVPTTA